MKSDDQYNTGTQFGPYFNRAPANPLNGNTDVKILANHILRRIPELSDDCFFVDPFGGADATRRNLASMRAALRWVKSGGVGYSPLRRSDSRIPGAKWQPAHISG